MSSLLRTIWLICLLPCLSACGQQNPLKGNIVDNMDTNKKIEVEVWSDVMCPFCYIGKRRFEAALAQFPHQDEVKVTWKSFQLSPDAKTQPGKSMNEFLAEHKGISVTQAQQLHAQVTQMAAGAGLTYNFDQAVVANSFNAHRFIHFAKKYGKQTEAKELVFKAHFTEGRNVDEYSTLIEIGKSIGLDPVALQTALEDGSFSEDVRHDMREAAQIGVRGVPYFLFNRKHLVYGAQETRVFLDALQKSWQEAGGE
jgi:predicted DsbA family dithiol-disulfide isomerase